MNEIYYKPLLSLIVGLLALFFIKARNERKRKILKKCKEVDAVITSVELEYGTGTGTTGKLYYPVVSFELGEETITQKYSDGYHPSRYEVNQAVTVQYLIDDPKEFLIKGDKTFMLDLIFIIFGIAAIGYSAFLFYQIFYAVAPTT